MTEQESASINCILCGQPIEPGDPCHAIVIGTYSNDNAFNEIKPVGLACECILHAAERHANGLPVYSNDCNAKEYVEHVKCMNAATEPDEEQRYIQCPKCEHGRWISINYEGPVSCKECGLICFTHQQKNLKED